MTKTAIQITQIGKLTGAELTRFYHALLVWNSSLPFFTIKESNATSAFATTHTKLQQSIHFSGRWLRTCDQCIHIRNFTSYTANYNTSQYTLMHWPMSLKLCSSIVTFCLLPAGLWSTLCPHYLCNVPLSTRWAIWAHRPLVSFTLIFLSLKLFNKAPIFLNWMTVFNGVMHTYLRT